MPSIRRAPRLTMAPRVLAIDFRPPAVPGNWFKAQTLIDEYIQAMWVASDQSLRYQVVDLQQATHFPALLGGREYNSISWLVALNKDSTAYRDARGNYLFADYQRILAEFNIIERVDSGEIDEVWMFGGPYFGFYESRMVGRGAFWCNGPAIEYDCRRFVIMGYNYQRSVKEMIHDFGHRSESILARKFGSHDVLDKLYTQTPPEPSAYPAPKNDFEYFLMTQGTTHRVPGGPDYGADERAWVTALRSAWLPFVVDPNKVE